MSAPRAKPAASSHTTVGPAESTRLSRVMRRTPSPTGP
jgi:hypothetical protein